MITLRRAGDRGHFDHGWLDTRHTFSFAGYHDPAHMGFRSLRVVNEDRVQPGRGFPTHAHQDMEILTWVVAGALEHKDSLGNGSVIRPGDAQRMTAGTGVTHSEYNPSRTDPVHFLQIWILPARRALPPGYEQRAFAASERRGRLRPIASADARDGSVTVHQDVSVYATVLDPGSRVTHDLGAGRHAWVQVVRGALLANDVRLEAGDGAAVSDQRTLAVIAAEETEALLFDLA
jgi:redox-sensitive bicupin YhaK (pirin superfamily)